MPHNMKPIHYLILLPLLAIMMVSCETKSQSSPRLTAASKVVRTDSAGVNDTISLSDSINVGDTIRLRIMLEGVYNTLTSLQVKSDTTCLLTAIEKDWDEESDAYLADGTDAEHGKLVFVPEKVYGWISTLRYAAVKSGAHTIDFTLSSSAGEGYSPRSFTLNVNVR